MRIVIDGNIGCGKSTQINMLMNQGRRCFKEPVDEWPLELFYSNPTKWALVLQISVLKSYAEPLDNCIYERCPQSSKYIFWELIESSKIDDEMYNTLYEEFGWHAHRTIYLRSLPEECYKRINKREQEGDSMITLEYLKRLHEQYEKMRGAYIIDIEGKTPEEINKEICKYLV
jgi:deoxycitidine kinase/deoxyguanosine kinase